MQLHDMWKCREMLRDHEKWTRGNVPYTHVVIARMDVTFYAPHADLLGLRRRASIGKTIGLTDIFAVCERKAADVYLSERVSILGQPTLISKWLQTGARRIGIYNPEMLLRDTLAHFGVPTSGPTFRDTDKFPLHSRYLRSLKTFGKFERPPRVKKNPLADEAVMKYADLFSATTSFDSSDQAFAYFRTKIHVFHRHSILPYYVIGFTPHWKVYDSGEFWSGPNRDGQQLISLYSKNVQELDARRILWRKQSAKERLAQNATFLQELLAAVDLEREQVNKENKRAEDHDDEEEVVDYAAGIQRLLDRVVARTTKRPEPVLRLLEAGRPEEQWPGHLTGEFVVEPSGMVAQPDNILKAIKEEETALFYQLRELSDHLLHYEEHLLDGTPSSATHFLEALFPYFDFRRSDFGAVA
eukprot:g8458.t1